MLERPTGNIIFKLFLLLLARIGKPESQLPKVWKLYMAVVFENVAVTAYVQDERCCLRFLALLSIGEFKTAFFAKFYQHDVMALVV